MSLKTLCSEIEQDSKMQASRLIKDARKEARQIIHNAEKLAAESIKSAKISANEFSKAEADEKLNAASIEAQKIISDAKDEAVKNQLTFAWKVFCEQTNRSAYKKDLRSWAKIAIDELQIQNAVLVCRAKDKQTLTSAGFKVAEIINSAGGVRAQSKDGKIISDYTLEAQFEQNKEKIARAIYSKLFSSSKPVVFRAKKKSANKKKKKKRGRR